MSKNPKHVDNISRRRALHTFGATALALLAGAHVLSISRPSNAIAAPSQTARLDEKQLGQLAFIDTLSRQLPNDWTYMSAEEPGQGDFDSYRYQLAMMSYALSLAHFHYTPAWPEHHRAVSRRLIDKMLSFEVWSYWELTSRGAKVVNPDLTALGKGWIDPIRSKNIMYSGHLFQMIATHEMLFGGGEFDKPGSLLFKYDPFGRGLGPQSFNYDIHSLANIIADQFKDNDWLGVECEPNAIFPECNQHPILAFSLYDKLYGTDYFPEISERFKKQFDRLKYLNPETNSFMTMYLVKQKRVLRNSQAWSDGWSGTFMHGWSREDIETSYPVQRRRHLALLADGTMTVATQGPDPDYSHGHGFMASLAAEIGDDSTRKAMLDYADKYWAPTWNNEDLIYPRNDSYKNPGDDKHVWRRVQPLTGNGLIALARLGGHNYIYTLFSQAPPYRDLRQPYISGIDYPKVHVAQAKYDAALRSLNIALTPGRTANSHSTASFVVENLDRQSSYRVTLNDSKVADIRHGNIVNHTHVMNIEWDDAYLKIQMNNDRINYCQITQQNV